jgi:hypothetical protein
MRMGEHNPVSPSSIEISEPVADKLHQICAKHEVPMKDLASELLMRMLCFHHREVKEIVETIKKMRVQVNPMHSEPYVTISISIPSKVLAVVDAMEGKNRNEKLVTCIRKGYDILRG